MQLFMMQFVNATGTYFIMILLSIYIYTIGLGTSFYNLLVPLHTNTLIA
jgi:hypothetical protein